jgi:hypothetical protein
VNAEELAEILGDFPSFCALLDIKTKAGGLVKFDWSRWHGEQRKFEQMRSGRDITIKGRQIGFTTMELARDLHFAITRKGVNVQVIVHDDKIKDQLFLNLRTMAMGLKTIGLLPATLYSNKTELVFKDLDSAVRIVESGSTSASAQKKGRSGTIHRLHATEIAFWGAAADTWTAMSAAAELAEDIIIESTANGAGGLFYEMVQAARFQRGGYKLHFFPWFEHKHYRAPIHDRERESFDPSPRDKWEEKLREAGCDDQQIRWWRLKVDAPEWGIDRTLQEYPIDADSCFRVAGRSYFEPDVIDRLSDGCREPKSYTPLRWSDGKSGMAKHLGDLAVWQTYDSAKRYIVGGDVSEGTGSDASTMTVIEEESAKMVATYWSDSVEPGDFGLAMAVVGKMYGMARLAPERNNHGHAALRAIVHEAHYPVGKVFSPDDQKLGWLTDLVTRPVMFDNLGAAIRTGIVTTQDREMVSECKTLVRNEKGKVEARNKGKKDGSKDDRFVSWVIAFAVRSKPAQKFQRVQLPGF